MSSHRYRHPIYGIKKRVVVRPVNKVVSSESYCYEPCPGIDAAFFALEDAIFNLERTLQQYYQSQRVVSEFVAKMSARCFIPPVLFVRLVWRETYKGEKFDTTNVMHRLQLKYIYLQYGFSYSDEPLFKDALGLTLV